MGKAKKVVFKKMATKVSKGLDIASKVAKPAAYGAKYNKEIFAAGKFLAKQAKKGGGGGDTMATLAKVAKAAKKVPWSQVGEVAYEGGKAALKDPRVQKAILDKSIGLGLKYGEKYADKKLGKYKAYRIAKGGVNLLYDVGTGNVGGALNEATNIYGEADPNKKRAAKVKAAVGGVNQMVSSAMKGDYAGAYGGALQTYAVADPNKKRVQKVMDINNKYVVPAYNLYQSANEFYDQASGAADVANRSKIEDAQAQIKNKKINAAIQTGSNLNAHKTGIIAAHSNQDYGAMAQHAKMLHGEAKTANKMVGGGPIGSSSVKPMQTAVPIGVISKKPASVAVGGSSKKPAAIVAPPSNIPIGGSGGKPRM